MMKGCQRCKFVARFWFLVSWNVLGAELRSAGVLRRRIGYIISIYPRALFLFHELLVWSQECFCGCFVEARYALQSSSPQLVYVHDSPQYSSAQSPHLSICSQSGKKRGSRAGPGQLHQGQKSNFSAPKNVSSHFTALLSIICCFLWFSFCWQCKSSRLEQKLIVWLKIENSTKWTLDWRNHFSSPASLQLLLKEKVIKRISILRLQASLKLIWLIIQWK